MKFCTALFFGVLFCGCIDRLYAPNEKEEAGTLSGAEETEPTTADVANTEVSNSSEFPEENTPVLSDQVVSILSSSLSELEEIVAPTVAPATPTFDTESSSPSNPAASSSVVSQSQASDGALASVILVPPKDPSQVQSSESHQSTEDFFSEAVPTSSPEVLSFKLDSRPQVPISSAPTPTPPTLAPVKVEEDSITSALNQADEESKPKEEEEMPSFDEFKRRVLQEEEEKSKQHSAQNASRTQQKPKPKKVKERKQSNYASIDCGAKILQSNPEASNTDSILVENRDLYMLNPCSAKIWFIVELCDLAQVKSIEIANFELFSSTPESFRVYVSQRFPTREWTLLGTFQAREEREIQSFPLDEPIYAKYAKVEMLSHFGSEHYCPLSLLRVYGSSMMEELEDHERDGQEDSDSGDSDVDDAAQVLPREPGAETESGPQTQTIFERAAETVLSFVKKFTGSGENDNVTVNGSESSSESSSENNAQTKQGIVTLMGHDETEEKVGADDPVPSPDVSQEKTKVMGPKNDGSLLYKDEQDMTNSCRALTTCQSFAQIIRHSGLGCLVGGMLLSKKQKIEAVEEKLKVVNHTMAKETCDKSDSSEKEKLGKISDLNGKAEKDNSDKEVNIQETPTLIENLEEKSTPSLKEIVENPDTPALTPSSSKVGEMSGVHGTVASSSLVTEMVDVLTRIVQPSDTVESVITDSQEKSDNTTPVLLEVSVVTSSPGNSTLSSLPYSQSSEIQLPKESDAELQEGENVQTSYESAKESSAKQLSSKVVELPVLVDEHKPSEDQDAFKPGLSSLADKAIPKDNEVAEPSALDQSSEATEESSRRQATQSECKAPNSLSMMSQSSPDIDVLETKLTDNEGREGTAELPKEEEGTAEDTNPPKAEQNQDHHIKSVGLDTAESDRKEEPVTTELKSGVDNIEAPSSVTGSQSTESTISSSKLNTEASDLADSVLPLPAPPLVSDTSSSSGHDIPISPDASLDKVQQGVTASAGAPGSSGSGTHKESIFVRLSNKIKALEQNLTLSTLYMEQLNQRYRKSLDEMQKNVDKKVALLTNATKKAELVINGQKEHISKLQAKVDELTNIVVDMKVRMDFLNKEVMERHIIGLCIEVILILFLFTLFRRRYYRQTVPDTPRGAGYLMNGHGPPRSANGSAASQEGNNLHTVLLSGREQLLRSFGKATEPETVGASATIDACNNKQQLKPDPYAAGESKKKRHRKRNKMANSPDATPEIYSCDPPSGPSSVVSRTAGLLFSNARGLLGGLTNPWKTRKTSLDRSVSVPSEENYFDHAPTSTKSPTMTRAKSLEIVPEETVSNIAPPPSPPPLPAQFGVALKRIPECYYSKKSNGQNIARGAIKYGKYGVLDTQLA